MAEAMKLLSWSFSDVDLDQAAMNKARTQRNDYKERRQKNLEEFIQVLCDDESMQPYLNVDFLMRFLRSSKFKCKRAHKKLKKYYSIKRLYPEIFRDFLPSFTLQAQSLNHLAVLPSRAEDNSLILLYKVDKLDPSLASFEEVMRLDRLVLESLLQNPVTQLCGVTLLIDFSGFSPLHAAQFTPRRMETLFNLYHNCNSFRIVNIHIANAPTIANALFDIAQARLMSEKVKARVFSHNSEDWASLHEYLPSKILPYEFSGHLESHELVSVYDLVNFNEDFFQEQLQLMTF